MRNRDSNFVPFGLHCRLGNNNAILHRGTFCQMWVETVVAKKRYKDANRNWFWNQFKVVLALLLSLYLELHENVSQALRIGVFFNVETIILGSECGWQLGHFRYRGPGSNPVISNFYWTIFDSWLFLEKTKIIKRGLECPF